MQSGITVSQELHSAFNSFVSDSSKRALLASIKNEALVPLTTVPLQSTFKNDLDALQQHISSTEAAYILLKLDPDASDGYAAVTFVPNAAPVRQKMLFASTRLALVRELGIERFRETLFATETSELTAEGWTKHEAHSKLNAPLTEEEAALGGVKEAEAAESQGTSTRRGHVSQKLDVKVEEGVVEALKGLDRPGTLVQLKYQLPDETLRLDSTTSSVSPSALSSKISASEPRYSFYSHASANDPHLFFIYTCPASSKVKERMIYSTGKRWTQIVAERDAGLTITKSLEASEPSEITEDMLGGETAEEERPQPAQKTFARPKRPGKR
ncbi:hypothetical protein AMS68_006531 [Peltaster fructicola]|uniref:ADF-H domain-containing protein n=1 Tax=Peltaster fructicola TaxID=286661 RepID=A0A6H0Y1X7_9PEZI|nr:hypothetical protein AMS68_006531 [Peltaster fructicola]